MHVGRGARSGLNSGTRLPPLAGKSQRNTYDTPNWIHFSCPLLPFIHSASVKQRKKDTWYFYPLIKCTGLAPKVTQPTNKDLLFTNAPWPSQYILFRPTLRLQGCFLTPSSRPPFDLSSFFAKQKGGLSRSEFLILLYTHTRIHELILFFGVNHHPTPRVSIISRISSAKTGVQPYRRAKLSSAVAAHTSAARG